MCQHRCNNCGADYSCQDFGIPLGNALVFSPCIFGAANLWICEGRALFSTRLQYDETQVCPRCYEEKRRWYSKEFFHHLWDREREVCTRCGTAMDDVAASATCHSPKELKLSFKGMLRKMEQELSKGKLNNSEIMEIMSQEEILCKDMTADQLEQHYFNCLRNTEIWRVHSLHVRKLKVDAEIVELASVSESDRAEFEEAKKRRMTKAVSSTAAIRKTRASKLVEEWTNRILKAHPDMPREDAEAKAKTLVFAD